ncbi:MAG: N-acetyl-gamma-glutamyl-phosphate reductase [Bacteroidaceae bacterium]|nr:N-acetyl-gamma-glutamyl-phosphate reductase [Bacteroidaceae bacterium]
MVRIGIVGAAGYTAGELCRVLINHPQAEIVWMHSESNAGNRVTDVHSGLIGDTGLVFTDHLDWAAIDVVFLCFGHGKSRQFLSENTIPTQVRIIDLAQDFRLRADHDFIYGLPELHRSEIAQCRHLANPGCFATCIQLGLLPLAAHNLLHGAVSVNAITGSTGAGVKPSATTHFSWRSGNMSIYKAFEHQHVPEIRQSLAELQPAFDADIDFIPYRGDFPRGIFATEVLRVPDSLDIAEVESWYEDFYRDAPFTHYSHAPIDLKQVVNTNKCLLHVEKHGSRLLVTSVIDNLLKGASGQAVQNMNLMFHLDETAGLRLKPLAF